VIYIKIQKINSVLQKLFANKSVDSIFSIFIENPSNLRDFFCCSRLLIEFFCELFLILGSEDFDRLELCTRIVERLFLCVCLDLDLSSV
jgi:hypothetical protein